MTQDTQRAGWLDTEERTCETCGQQYESLVIYLRDKCPACAKVAALARSEAFHGHALDHGYSVSEFGGACPYQVEGVAADGRPFYFRARHGDWVLRVGPPEYEDDYQQWADHAEIIARGDDPANGWPEDEFVLPILDDHVGAGVSR